MYIKISKFENLKIFIILIISLYLFIINLIKIKKYNKNIKLRNSYNNEIINRMKVCLCTLGKKENKYIREFIKYYVDFGIDKIINDFINNKYVKIINYRGLARSQLKILNDCYKNNYNKYNWLLFYDIDEFLYLRNYKNIKYFLIEKKFKKYILIHLNLIYHTDNNLLYYENKSLSERFPEKRYKNLFIAKTILRGHIPGIKITSAHWINYKIVGCNGYGKKIKLKNYKYIKPDFRNYYINHYAFKSTEEFINKINRGSCYYGINNKTKLHKINVYFCYNKITLKKINFIEQKTKLNLDRFRKKINKLLSV